MNAAAGNAWKLAGAVILIVVAAIIFSLNSNGPPPPATSKTIHGVSLATGKEHTLQVPVLEQPPYEDPDSGERCVYPWLYSYETGKRFVPQLVRQGDGPPKMPMIPRCPETGGDATSWSPTLSLELGRESQGDLPLPEWPVKGD